MKTIILIFLIFLTHSVWAQRAVYVTEGNKTTQPKHTVKLTENASIALFVAHLKLDTVQQQKVQLILVKQKLRPVKGEVASSPFAMSYERRRALFEKEMKAVLSEKQYIQFMSMQ